MAKNNDTVSSKGNQKKAIDDRPKTTSLPAGRQSVNNSSQNTIFTGSNRYALITPT